MSQYKYFNIEDYRLSMQKDDWYLKILPEIQLYILNTHDKGNNFTTDIEKKEFIEKRREFIMLISEFIDEIKNNNDVKNERIFDKERKEIDTIVIHHSSMKSDLKIKFLETLHLLNLYVREFVNESKYYYGKKIFSGHILNEKQTFIAYHYIIYPNGDFIQCLKDEYIGWHCGNWDYNCRSIAICFYADLENSSPTESAIATANQIIKKYNPKNLLGHREIKPTTSCPGNKFLGSDGWKQKLIY